MTISLRFFAATSACFVLSALGSPLAGRQVPSSASELSWRPARPQQGTLFVVRVGDPRGRRIAGVRGETSGEELHFDREADGSFRGIAPVPIEASGVVELSVVVSFANGSRDDLEATVPVEPGRYAHERLTVAPQFGAPPDSAARVRLDRDRARAREVSRLAHRTPRIWGDLTVLPRDDRVTGGFGDGREFNGQISSRHMGLDLDGDRGDVVVAAARGVVALVDDFLLAGNIVYVNHGGGLLSGYFHLSEQLVSVGDTVEAGTPIGRVGATGRVTGPHLHWVVRYGFVSVDPRSLLALPSGTPAPDGR